MVLCSDVCLLRALGLKSTNGLLHINDIMHILVSVTLV